MQKKFEIVIFYLLFHLCLNPDPKQIITDPNPVKSAISNRIRIRNTEKKAHLLSPGSGLLSADELELVLLGRMPFPVHTIVQ